MTFENQDVQIEFFSPNLETSLGESIVVTVGDGVETTTSSKVDADDNFGSGYSIDITENSITYETSNDVPVEDPVFNSGEFNGVVFSDADDTIPEITSVTIDRETTTLGLDASDIEFTEDTISLNLEGTDYIQGELVELDVEFASTDNEPEPVEPVDSPIEITISSPSSIVADGTDEVTVTYTNTGDTDAIAPLLSLEADGALLQSNDGTGFTESQIQFLGINNEGQAGVLAPGDSNSFTVQFMADGTSEEEINFSVSSIDRDEEIDWESLRESSRPDFIAPEAWNEIYDNFVAEVGTTAGDYQQLLVENANYLSSLGEYEADVDDLLAFEFQQASDYQAIAQRNSLGSFGRGRTFIGDIELSVDDGGNVAIDNTGTRRTFDLLPDDTYQGQTGDFASLSLDDGVYTLTEPDGTATVFNSDGQIDFIADPNNNRLDAEYTGDRLTSLTDSFSNSLDFEYNADGRIVDVNDSDGRTTTYTYDETGELLESVTDEAGTTTYTYDGVALASITDPNGTTIEFTYDDRGRLTQQSVSGEDAATEVLNYSYGEAGEVTVTDADGNETELLLNENGQVGQLTDANGRLINFSYDSQGNLTQIIAPENNSTLFGYDDRGNLTSQVDAEGNITEFTYEDTFNQLTGFSDPNGNGIDYSYDESGNLTTITYEDGSSETFSYNDNGDVTVSANRRGQEILYSYNDRGQIVSQINSDARGITIDYTYDERGNLDTVTNANGTIDLDYDESDRLTSITYPNGRFLEYTYDEGDRRTSLSDQDGDTVNYAYDDAGRLSSLTDGDDNPIVSYQYDEVGRLSREDKGNGTYTQYRYDLAGQLLSIENFAPDDTLNSSSIYTYDSLGRQTSLTTLDGEWTYDYDATGQLTEAVFASTNPDIPSQDLTYEYDAAGNRINTIENGESTDYTTNNLNQYTEVGGFDYQYDDDGNLVSRTNEEGTTSFSYNSENQLIGVTEPDGTVTIYEYNPFGDRVASVVDGERTEYLVDPFGFGDVVGEYDEDGDLIASYTHGLGLESITNVEDSFYYDFNATGSTVGLTDADGGVVNSYFYDPFGDDIAETEAVANPFEFVGQFGVAEEANGLDFMRARFYDSDTGRFISPDPIGLNGSDTNLYRYSFNNPVLFVDPNGLLSRRTLEGIENTINKIDDALTGVEIIDAISDIDILDQLDFLPDLPNFNFGDSVEADVVEDAVDGAITNGIIQGLRGAIAGSIAAGPVGAVGGFVLGFGGGAIIGFFEGGAISLIKNRDRIFEERTDPLLVDVFIDNLFTDSTASSNTDIVGDAAILTIPDRPDNQARSKGEPHLTTFDGVGYDFQGAGDFTLVESVNGDFDVQVRYVQIDDNVTVASAVATEVDGQNVVIDSEGIEFVEDPNNLGNLIPRVTRSGGGGEATVTIDGEEVQIASGGSIDVGNSRIFRSSGEEYTIVYAGENGVLEDGDDQLVVNYFRPGTINIVDVYLGDEQQGNITGLLGNLNGNPDDDIALRDGTVLPRPLEFDRLYGDYREDYRVASIEESLFTYEDGQSPDTFYNPNFPEALLTYDTLSPELRAKGDAAALEAGYEPGTFEFESVAFDFAITCDPAFLEGRETDPEAMGVDIVDNDDNEDTNNDNEPDEGEGVTPEEPTGEEPGVFENNTFDGAEVQVQAFDTDFDGNLQPASDIAAATIVEDFEFTELDVSEDGFANGFLDFDIDVDITSATEGSIFVESDIPGSATFASGIFSGYVFTFLSDDLPAIENVTIDESINTFGIEPSDVIFTENTVGINFARPQSPSGTTPAELEFIEFGDTFRLDIDFADGEAAGSLDDTPILSGEAAGSLNDEENTQIIETTGIIDPNDIEFDDFTFEGAEVQLQRFEQFGDRLPNSDIFASTIDDGLEFTDVDDFRLADFNFDISIESEETGSIFVESRFNRVLNDTFVFTFISDDIPPIENVTIDESINTFGIDTSDISFNNNTIEIDINETVLSLDVANQVSAGDAFRINIDFADV